MQPKKRMPKSGAGVILLTLSGVAFATGCPPVADEVWQGLLLQSGASLAAGIVAAAESISASRTLNYQRVQSALRVVTKQIDVTGSKGAATDVAAKQGSANYMSSLATSRAAFDVLIQYNAASGQGFEPCAERSRSQRVALAIGESNNDMQEKVLREVEAAPGRAVANQAAYVASRVTAAKNTYCTEAESRSGYCSQVGPMAGMDVDGANFFTPNHISTGEAKAKSALLNNLYGIPDAAPSKDVVNTPAGVAYFEAKRSSDAIRSVSQNSLKTIQSWTESKGAGGVSIPSVTEAIAEKVGTYAGGANYVQWERDKLSQSERGLLVDFAKQLGFELYMKNIEYQQSERMEANLASLLVLRTRAMAGVDSRVLNASARAKVQ